MIAREGVKAKLLAWQSGEENELGIWRWADDLKRDIANTPAADDLVRDIIDLLAALPYEMLVAEDIDVLLDALANPPEDTDLSINLLWNHMDGFDADSRRAEYANHPFYGEFVGLD